MVSAAWSLMGQHYKVTMSALSQISTHRDMTLNIARYKTANKLMISHRTQA